MKYQVCRDLTPIEYEALKADIAENGVLVPVEVDENGEILDGHHRVRAWEQLRAEGASLPAYARLIRSGLTEEQKRNHARKLNLLRRQMSVAERDRIIAEMLADGATTEEAGKAAGVSDETARSVSKKLETERPTKVTGKDGKRYPTSKPRQPKPQTLFDGGESVAVKSKPHVSNNSGVNEWYTPAVYVNAARFVLGSIDLDPASSEKANEIVGAERYFTIEEDSLAQSWQGTIWMNPPYSSDLIGKFVDKLLSHVRNGDVPAAVVLVNNATETTWFQQMAEICGAICFPSQRIRFWSPNGALGAPLQGQAILYFGGKLHAFRDVFSSFGFVLRR